MREKKRLATMARSINTVVQHSPHNLRAVDSSPVAATIASTGIARKYRDKSFIKLVAVASKKKKIG